MPEFDEDVIVNGQVGINIAPRADLHTDGRIMTTPNGEHESGVSLLPDDGWAWWHIDNGAKVDYPNNSANTARQIGKLRFSTGEEPGANEHMCITQEGNVGLGVEYPKARLDIDGDIHVTGDVVLRNADCAEEFDVACDAVSAGMVLSLGPAGQLVVADSDYDTRVAGIVAGAPPYRPAIVMDRRETGHKRVPVALLGKVMCRVDASRSPIEVGTLLTTSSTPGHAMAATERSHAIGAILGKSLGTLADGVGEVPVLVSLQ